MDCSALNRTIKVNIIRHGKTLLNEQHCYIGVTDDGLSVNGKKEIQNNKDLSLYPDVKQVFVSPMKRAVETAGIIYPEIVPEAVQEFREMDFGSFEGKNYQELKDNLYYRRWIDKSRGVSHEELEKEYGELDDPDKIGLILPEDNQSFFDRTLKGFYKVIRECQYDEISLVVHGGTLMAILSTLTREDYYSFMLPCGGGVCTEVVTKYNETGNIDISCFRVTGRICS